MKNNKPILINTIIMAIAVVTSLGILLPKSFGIFYPPDEFGYWNNAAKMAGLDWGQIANGQSAYGYGYSFLLFWLIKLASPVTAYHISIILNALMMIMYAYLATSLAIKLCRKYKVLDLSGDKGIIVLSLLIDFYPGISVYLHYSIAEILICFLFMALMNVAWDISENGLHTWKVVAGFILCFVLCVVHYRNVGILAAYILLLLVIFLNSNKRDDNKQKKAIIAGCIVVLALMVGAGCFLFYSLGYVSFIGTTISSYSVLRFFIEMVGRYFYAGCATFFVGTLGIIKLYKERKDRFSSFVIASTLLSWAISSAFFMNGNWTDQVIFGRYTECFIPIFICYGYIYILTEKIDIKHMLSVIISMGIIATLLTAYIRLYGMHEYLDDFVAGVDWMFGRLLPPTNLVYEKPFYIASVGFALLIIATSYFSKRKILTINICVSLLAAVFICASTWNIAEHVGENHINNKSDYLLSLKVAELTSSGRSVTLADTPYNNYANLMQYWLPDVPIKVVRGFDPAAKSLDEEAAFKLDENEIILSYADYEYREELAKRHEHVEESAHFIIYYN